MLLDLLEETCDVSLLRGFTAMSHFLTLIRDKSDTRTDRREHKRRADSLHLTYTHIAFHSKTFGSMASGQRFRGDGAGWA
jgi:hypothetical protein